MSASYQFNRFKKVVDHVYTNKLRGEFDSVAAAFRAYLDRGGKESEDSAGPSESTLAKLASGLAAAEATIAAWKTLEAEPGSASAVRTFLRDSNALLLVLSAHVMDTSTFLDMGKEP